MIDELGRVVMTVGDEIAKRRHSDATGGTWQGDQLKTAADVLSHRMMTEGLRALCDLPVVSEEDPDSLQQMRPEMYWLIDPIDGTRSLVEGFPGWVVQAALILRGEPQLAAVYAPDLNQLFTSRRGGGSWCNGVPLHVDRSIGGRAVLIDNYPQPKGVAAEAMASIPCSGYLECGSIALKICRVADGTADLFIKDVVVRDWDVAAPMLVLSEAGGQFGMSNGDTYRFAGCYEKSGLIAARSEELFGCAVAFLTQRRFSS